MLTMKYRAIYFFFKTLAYAWLFYQIWLLFGIIDGVCPCAKSTEQTIKGKNHNKFLKIGQKNITTY